MEKDTSLPSLAQNRCSKKELSWKVRDQGDYGVNGARF